MLANRSRYALGATVYTTKLEESMRAVDEIEAGMVWVNAPLLDNDAGPFGGRKQSGMGRQLGREGLDTFRHTKFAMIDPAAQAHDFWWFPYADAESYSRRATGPMNDIAPELEERIARLEGDLRSAAGPDFDAVSWGWIITLGVVLPAVLLLIGWWYPPGNY